jgi:hypothetical protein
VHPPSPTFSDHLGPINVLPHWTHFVESTGVLAGSNVLLLVFDISESPLGGAEVDALDQPDVKPLLKSVLPLASKKV